MLWWAATAPSTEQYSKRSRDRVINLKYIKELPRERLCTGCVLQDLALVPKQRITSQAKASMHGCGPQLVLPTACGRPEALAAPMPAVTAPAIVLNLALRQPAPAGCVEPGYYTLMVGPT